MTTADLQHGQLVRCRLGRHGREAIDWHPWREGRLYLQRRTVLPRGAHRRGLKLNDILTLTIEGCSWAEYSQQDYVGGGVFNAEDYNLQIEGLV